MSDYKQILKDIGWPTEIIVLDFESYFDQDYTLSKMSTIEYIEDSRFEFTGLGLLFDQDNAKIFTDFVEPNAIQTYLTNLQASHQYGTNFKEATIVVQNAKFDATVLKTKFGINPLYIIDIVDLARHYDARMSHHLKDLCKMFKLPDKGDTLQFKGLHWKDMTLLQRCDLQLYCEGGDVLSEWSLFKKLLPMLSNPKMELELARHTLKMYLEPQIEFDFEKAKELKQQMNEERDRIIAESGYTKEQLSGDLSFAQIYKDTLESKGETLPLKPGKPTKNMIKITGVPGMIPACAKDDVPFQKLLAHSDSDIRNLCVARQAVKSWPLHIKRIDNMTRQAKASGGKLRVPLHYYGGHTGRWSGGEKINPQNLGGRGRAGSGVHPLISSMRSLLRAPENSTFAIADSAQIEARVLAWLAGQQDLVEGFANGEDIYSVFATELFQSEVHKPSDDDPEPVKKLLKIRRGFGKDAILGCGYGMGAQKFYDRCVANQDLRPLFDSGEYNFAFIENLIKTYRGTYQSIPEFWREIEKLFKWVIKYPHDATSYSLPFPTNQYVLNLWNDNGTINLQLPSGRTLIYRHCRLAKDGNWTTIQWHHGHLWGGSITENTVQAIARDLLGYWILLCEEDGYPIVLHAHDEIISAVEKETAKADLNNIAAIMQQAPDWAAGLPLNVDRELSEIYIKA